MFSRLFTLVTASLALAAAPAFAADITLHGSTTVSANLALPHKSDIESKSGQVLKVISNGSSNGIKGVVSGAADIGMISAPLEAVVAKVNKKAPGTVAEGSLTAHQVGEARVAFTVHKSNTVTELTLDQITNILNGTTKNWSEIGGANKPIMIITEVSGGGLRSMVEGELLGKASIAGTKKELPNGTQVPKLVAQIPHALGVMSAVLVNDSMIEIKTDAPVAQPLIFVTKGDASAEVQAVIDAAKSVGGM